VEVDVVIDELWRLEVSQQHTAQHIFSALAEQLYGWPSEGFAIFEDESKLNFLVLMRIQKIRTARTSG